jgi:ABC-type polysaccharide/polyol phosphate export permease
VLNALKSAPADCVRYWEVLYHLLARDLKLKYKHTLLGYFWSLLNPVFQIGVLSLVFSHLVRWDMKNYTMYLFSGFVGWMFFQASVATSSMTFIENANFLRKIYLPKILFPVAKVAFRAIDFMFSIVALTLIAAILGYRLPPTMAALPAAIGIFVVFTLGISILMSVATVFFRDTTHLQGVFFQLLYFATPIIYPLSALPPAYQKWMAWNPLYIQVRLFQRLISDGVFPTGEEWLAALGTALLSLGAGLLLLDVVEEEIVFRL